MTTTEHVILSSLFAFGSYQISGRSVIAQPLRDLVEALKLQRLSYLLSCAQCSGLWYGVTYGAGALWLGNLDGLTASCIPFVTSGVCLFLSSLLDKIESRIENGQA